MDVVELLAISIKNNASDLHLSVGLSPMIRVEKELKALDLPLLEHHTLSLSLHQLMNEPQRKEFAQSLTVDFSYSIPHLARFRVHLYQNSRGIAATFRIIPETILSIEDLGLTSVVRDLVECHQGLILITCLLYTSEAETVEPQRVLSSIE